jgi:hypothetical protein
LPPNVCSLPKELSHEKHPSTCYFSHLPAPTGLHPSRPTPGNDLLAQYRKIQAETKNSRLFRYDDGAPKSNYYTVEEDQFGYLWLATDAFRIYRFNGVAFTEMSASFPKAERDSLIKGSLFSDDDKTIHLIGRNYVYRWNGYRFIKYIFPKRDRIREYQCLNNRILAVGDKGYAVLKGDSWKYTAIHITHYSSDDGFNGYTFNAYASEKNMLVKETSQKFALDYTDACISYTMTQYGIS